MFSSSLGSRLTAALNDAKNTAKSMADEAKMAARNAATTVADESKKAAKTMADAAKVAAANGQERFQSVATKYVETLKAKEECAYCGREFSSVLAPLSRKLERCCLCGCKFCDKCILQSSAPLPADLLHPECRGTKGDYFCKYGVSAGGSDSDNSEKDRTTTIHQAHEEKAALAWGCHRKVTDYLMELFRWEEISRYDELIAKYVVEGEKQMQLYCIPEKSRDDTLERKALRLARLAEVAASVTGWDYTFKAMKYAYLSRDLISMLIGADFGNCLGPLMEAIKAFGITGPTAILAVHYLSCKNDLDFKMDPTLSFIGHEPEDIGVVSPTISAAQLTLASRYAGPAEWLYLAKLPPPHDNNEWNSWYLSQVVSKQGWTVLVCNNEATKLPDGKRCPAFALAVRSDPTDCDVGSGNTSSSSKSSSSKSKEAILVIRGTKSSMDWTINLDEEPMSYTYLAGGPPLLTTSLSSSQPSYSSASVSGSEESKPPVIPVEGKVHSGMFRAAKGILDDYNLRSVLLDIMARGYSVTIVGHSLGAGTAAILAMELKNTIVDIYNNNNNNSTALLTGKQVSTSKVGVTVTAGGDATGFSKAAALEHAATQGIRMGPSLAPPRQEGKPLQLLNSSKGRLADAVKAGLMPSVQVVGYGTAPCVCEILAEALRQDGLMVSVVLGDDPITRFSRVNMANLAQEVRSFAPLAETWKNQDIESFKSYTKKYGRASTPTPLSHTTEALAGVKTAVVAASNSTASAAATVASKTTQATAAMAHATMASANAVVGRVRGATLTSTEPPAVVDEGEHLKNPIHSISTPASFTAPSAGFHHNFGTPGTSGSIPTGGGGRASSSPSNVMDERLLFIDEDLGSEVNLDDDPLATGPAAVAAAAASVADRRSVQAVHAQSAVDDYDLLDDIDGSGFGAMPADPLGAGFVRLVPPGVILHLYKKHGRYTASEITQNHPTLTRLVPRCTIGVDDHKMTAYRSALRAMRYQRMHSEVSKVSVSGRAGSRGVDLLLGYHNAGGHIARQAISRTSERFASELPVPFDSSPAASYSAVEDTAAAAAVFAVTTEASPANRWMPCSVCELDCIWAYVLRNDAARARVTHTCSSCGRVVCAVCSPSGDEIPADGFNQTTKLSDLRMALPSIGEFTPQRVCLHCYLDACEDAQVVGHTHPHTTTIYPETETLPLAQTVSPVTSSSSSSVVPVASTLGAGGGGGSRAAAQQHEHII